MLERELDDDDLRRVELQRDNLDLPEDTEKLGSGAFGCVMMGWICSHDENIRVAVKQLQTNTSYELKSDFIREAKISLRVDHVNVVRLLHVCSQDEPYLMIMEYVNRVYHIIDTCMISVLDNTVTAIYHANHTINYLYHGHV